MLFISFFALAIILIGSIYGLSDENYDYDLNNISHSRNISYRMSDEGTKFTIRINNNNNNTKAVPPAIALSLILILLGVNLASIPVSAQLVLSYENMALSLNQIASSPPDTTRIIFTSPQMSPEIIVTPIISSTNKTCTVTPSLTEIEGTPQQTEGPYFVDVCRIGLI